MEGLGQRLSLMGTIACFLVFTLGGVLTTSRFYDNVPHLCRDQPAGLTRLPSRRCDAYIECFAGMAFVRLCAPGTHFNPKTSHCDLTLDKDCRHGYGGHQWHGSESQKFGHLLNNPVKGSATPKPARVEVMVSAREGTMTPLVGEVPGTAPGTAPKSIAKGYSSHKQAAIVKSARITYNPQIIVAGPPRHAYQPIHRRVTRSANQGFVTHNVQDVNTLPPQNVQQPAQTKPPDAGLTVAATPRITIPYQGVKGQNDVSNPQNQPMRKQIYQNVQPQQHFQHQQQLRQQQGLRQLPLVQPQPQQQQIPMSQAQAQQQQLQLQQQQHQQQILYQQHLKQIHQKQLQQQSQLQPQPQPQPQQQLNHPQQYVQPQQQVLLQPQQRNLQQMPTGQVAYRPYPNYVATGARPVPTNLTYRAVQPVQRAINPNYHQGGHPVRHHYSHLKPSIRDFLPFRHRRPSIRPYYKQNYHTRSSNYPSEKLNYHTRSSNYPSEYQHSQSRSYNPQYHSPKHYPSQLPDGKTTDEQMMLNMFEKLKINTRDESIQMAHNDGYMTDFKSEYSQPVPEGKAAESMEYDKSVPKYTYNSKEVHGPFSTEERYDYPSKYQPSPHDSSNGTWNYDPYINSKNSFPNYHSPKDEGAKAYTPSMYEEDFKAYPKQSSEYDPDYYDKYGYDYDRESSGSDGKQGERNEKQRRPPTTPTPIWIHPFARGGSVFKSRVDDTKNEQSSSQDPPEYNDYNRKEYPEYGHDTDSYHGKRYPRNSFPSHSYKESAYKPSDYYPESSDRRDFKRGTYSASRYPDEDYYDHSDMRYQTKGDSRKGYAKMSYDQRDYGRNTDSGYSQDRKDYYPRKSHSSRRDQQRYSKDSYDENAKPRYYSTHNYPNDRYQDRYREKEHQSHRNNEPQERQYKEEDRRQKKNEDPYQHAKNRERSNKPTNPDSYYNKDNPGPFRTDDSNYPYAKQNAEGDQQGEGPDEGGTHTQYGRKPPNFDSFPFNFMPKHLTGPLFTDTGSTNFQKEAGFGHVANLDLDENGEVQYDFTDNRIPPPKAKQNESSVKNANNSNIKEIQDVSKIDNSTDNVKNQTGKPEVPSAKAGNGFISASKQADSTSKSRRKRHTGYHSPHMGMNTQPYAPRVNYNTRNLSPRMGYNSPSTNYDTRSFAPHVGLNSRGYSPNTNYGTKHLAPRVGLNNLKVSPNTNYNTQNLAPRFNPNTNYAPRTNYNTKQLAPRVGLNTRQLAPNHNYNTRQLAPKVGLNTGKLAPKMNYNTANLAPKSSAPNPSMRVENLNRLVHTITLDYDIDLPLNDGGFADQWHSSSKSKGKPKGFAKNFFRTLKEKDPYNAYYSYDMGNAYGGTSSYKEPAQGKSGQLNYDMKGGQESYYVRKPEDVTYPPPLQPFELAKYDLGFAAITPSPKTQKQIFLETIHIGTGGTKKDFMDSFTRPKYDYDKNNRWSDDKWSDAKWGNDKWSNEKWPEEKWSNDKWSNDKWSNEKWSNDKWSNDKWSNDKWTDNKWPSAKWADDKWSNEKWSAEKWPSDKWGSNDDKWLSNSKWSTSNYDSPYSGGKFGPKYGMKKAAANAEDSLKRHKKPASKLQWLA